MEILFIQQQQQQEGGEREKIITKRDLCILVIDLLLLFRARTLNWIWNPRVGTTFSLSLG
jgi:hypothetical protein